jgi:uncharacterized protein with ParB-like and HNH nuclease domain
MPVVYLLEACKSAYQRKTNCSLAFTDKKTLCQVLEVLVEEWDFNFRVFKVILEDNECLDLQEMARENTKSMEELNEEERELTIEDILGVLIYGHD